MIIFSEDFVKRHGFTVAALMGLLVLFMWWEWPNIARQIIEELE